MEVDRPKLRFEDFGWVAHKQHQGFQNARDSAVILADQNRSAVECDMGLSNTAVVFNPHRSQVHSRYPPIGLSSFLTLAGIRSWINLTASLGASTTLPMPPYPG